MRTIDPAVSGLRAGRTSLLCLGDDECRFGVLETDDPLAGHTLTKLCSDSLASRNPVDDQLSERTTREGGP